MIAVSPKSTNKDVPEQSGARKFLYDILYPFGLISTCGFLFTAFMTEFAYRNSEFKPVLSLRNASIMLVFCFLFAVANRIFHIKNMKFGVKIALHCCALTGDFIFTFILLDAYYAKQGAESTMKIIAIFIAVYLIIAIIAAIIRYIINRKKIERTHYTKQFRA